MLKNAYVVESENTSFWWETKELAEEWIEKIKSEGQEDIRFTHSEVEIDESDKNIFNIIKDFEVIY